MATTSKIEVRLVISIFLNGRNHKQRVTPRFSSPLWYPLQHSDMPNDVIVAWIADGRPESRCPRPIDLDQHRNALHTPRDKDLFDAPHKLSCNSLTSVARMYDQAIHVAPPAIEGAEQRSDDLALVYSQHKHRRRIRSYSAHVIQPISCAHARAGFLPESENFFRVIWRCRSKFHRLPREKVSGSVLCPPKRTFFQKNRNN